MGSIFTARAKCVMSFYMSTYALKIVKSNVTNFTKIGDIGGLYYNVSGHVFAENQETIFIANFNYSGGGPDAYFWVGTAGTPRRTDEASTAILAHPFNGEHFAYEDLAAPRLGEVVNEDIRLTLPPHLKVKDLRWLSVWCRAFNANFGELMFLDNYNGNVDVKSDDGYVVTTLADDENDNATTIATTMVNMTTVEVTTEEEVTLAPNEVVLQEMKPRNSKDLKEENPSPPPIIEKMMPPTTVKNIDQLTNTGQVAFPNLVIFIIVIFVL